MNKLVCEYIEIILQQIKYKKVHKSIAIEIENHIDELSKKFISEGVESDKAVEMAVSQMGDPAGIGKNLNAVHKPKPEWSLISLIIAAAAFGLYIMMVYSDTLSNNIYFYRHIFFTAIGIVVFLLCYFMDYKKLERYSLHFYIAVNLLLLLLVFSNSLIHGKRYFRIADFKLDPVIMSIPFLILFYAGIVKKWCSGKLKDMLKLVLISLLPIFTFQLQPSLTYTFIIAAGFLIMLTIGIMDKSFKGNKKKYIAAIYGSIIFAFTLAMILSLRNSPYIFQRLTMFINPQKDPLGAGYLGIQIKKIMSASAFTGSSIISGNGITAAELPGASAEFVFTFIVSTFGRLFGAILILLLTLFILRMFKAAFRVKDRYGRYICIGICLVFSLQIAANIFMNLGLLPLSGVTLPFVSYGGEGFICNTALVGLLVGIYRRKDIILEEPVICNPEV